MSNVLGCFLLTGFQLALLSTAYGDHKLVDSEVECVDSADKIVVSFPSDCISCNLRIVLQCETLEIIVKVVMVLKIELSQPVINCFNPSLLWLLI